MFRNRMRSLKIAVPVLVAFGSSVFTAQAAMSSQVLLQSKLYGNIPNVAIRGVQAGGAPWVVDGKVKLTPTELTATGKWLIIPKTGYLANGKQLPKGLGGTTAGATAVVAAITFANSPTIITRAVSLNKSGDFAFHIHVHIPKTAAQPVVLIGPPGSKKDSIGSWWASSDFLMDYGQYQAGGASGGMGASSTGGSSSSSGW